MGCLIIANGLAFQLSSRGALRECIPRAAPNPTDFPNGANDIVGLTGKLEILQGVVKELSKQGMSCTERIVALRNDHTIALSGLETKHRITKAHDVSKIEELLETISRLEKQQDETCEKVESIASGFVGKTKELQLMQQQFARKEEELERASSNMILYEKEIKEMQKMLEDIEESEAQMFLKGKNDRIEELENLITEQNTEASMLREQLLKCETKCKEHVEIATAAVEAAEKRAKNGAKELSFSESLRKRSQVQLKLQQLVIQGLLAKLEEHLPL